MEIVFCALPARAANAEQGRLCPHLKKPGQPGRPRCQAVPEPCSQKAPADCRAGKAAPRLNAGDIFARRAALNEKMLQGFTQEERRREYPARAYRNAGGTQLGGETAQ